MPELARCGIMKADKKKSKAEEAELNFRKEQLSVVFLSAVLAKVGGDVQETHHWLDKKGIDANCYVDDLSIGTIRATATSFKVQLKATSSPKERREYFSLPLKPRHYKAYRRLACEGNVPFFLCLFILPDEFTENDWLVIGEEELLLRGKMFWAEFDCASNKKTVRFMKNNKVDENGIKQIVLRSKKILLGGL